MFVLVVDTSLMNVSIVNVVRDLDTTVSGVQAAIALEALVSAAFILIGGKVGDLIGRKRAYALGLVGYAIRHSTRTDRSTDHRTSVKFVSGRSSTRRLPMSTDAGTPGINPPPATPPSPHIGSG